MLCAFMVSMDFKASLVPLLNPLVECLSCAGCQRFEDQVIGQQKVAYLKGP